MPIVPTQWSDVPNMNWSAPEDKDVLRFDVWKALYKATKERAKGRGYAVAQIGFPSSRQERNFRNHPLNPLYTPLELGETISALAVLNTTSKHIQQFFNHTKDLDLDGLTHSQLLDKRWSAPDLLTATGETSWWADSTNIFANSRLDGVNKNTGVFDTLKTIIRQQYKILNLLRVVRLGERTSGQTNMFIGRERKRVGPVEPAEYTSWASCQSAFASASWVTLGFGAGTSWDYRGLHWSGPIFAKWMDRITAVPISDSQFLDYTLSGDIHYYTYTEDAGWGNFEPIGMSTKINKWNSIGSGTFAMPPSFTQIGIGHATTGFQTDTQLNSRINPEISGDTFYYVPYQQPSPFQFVWDLRGANGFKFRDW